MQTRNTYSPGQETPKALDPELAVDAIQAGARYAFRPDEFALLTGYAAGSKALKHALHRLRTAGRIVNVTRRPSCWLIVPPEHRHYGAPPVLWWLDDCVRAIAPDYYVGLLSAARHWGSAHFASQVVQVVVGRPHPDLAVGRLRVCFVTKQGVAATPTETVRGEVAAWRVSTREATVLDLLRHQAGAGGLEVVARVVKDLSEQLTEAGIQAALEALGQTSAAQRFGFLLERFGAAPQAKMVETWLGARRQAVRELAPLEGSETVRTEARWQVAFTNGQATLLDELR